MVKNYFKLPFFKGVFVVYMLVGLSSCGPAIKLLSGMRNPEVETKSSILAILNQSTIVPFESYILEGNQDTNRIIGNISKSVGHSFFLFDSVGVPYKYCGTSKCSGIRLTEVFDSLNISYSKKLDDSLKLEYFLHNTVALDTVTNHQSYNYYLVFYWSKFYHGEKNTVDELNSLAEMQNKSAYNIGIILINTDLQADWGLIEGKKIHLKFKYRNKQVQVKFKKIPYVVNCPISLPILF